MVVSEALQLQTTAEEREREREGCQSAHVQNLKNQMTGNAVLQALVHAPISIFVSSS